MEKNAPTLRGFLFATALVCFLIVLVSFFAILRGNQVIEQREREGLYVDATVVDKGRVYESSGTRGGYVNALTVMFFEQSRYKDEQIELAEGFEITMPRLVDMGDLHRVEIRRVSRSIYNSVAEGDEVRIVYLASDPDQAWLAAEVEDVQVWNGMGFVTAVFALALSLAIISWRLPRV